MDAELLGRLTCAEEDLVSAMLIGDSELAAYDFAWTSLLDEISQASTFGDISNTTLTVADDVVARVSTLVECCLSLSSVTPPSPPLLGLNIFSPSPFQTITTFIPEAYSWLLENIANPYPSLEFKASLAQRYNSPVSAVSSWFANARRRMGWTALCRDFFRNCRADAVDAAYRILVKGDPNHQLGPEITHAFVTMKVTAEGLYVTSAKSALAGDFDRVMRDMLAEEKIVCSKERGGYAQKQPAHIPDMAQKNSMAPIYYRSRDPSPSSSPVPHLGNSLTDESEEDISPPSLAGRKRRSSSELAQLPGSRITTRSVKRPRLSSSLVDPRLPSPSTSTKETSENDTSDQTSREPGAQKSGNINSYQRCLAHPHVTRMPKHLGAPIAEPCLHSVSDPLPLSTLESEHSIDEWFKTNFDALFAIPPPVDVTELDLSTQWDVELFNNYSNREDLKKTLAPHHQISSSMDLIAFEDLLQSIESGGIVAPPELMDGPTVASVPDPLSQGLSPLLDIPQSIDWTALLNENTLEPAIDSLFPQSHIDPTLPEIDLSMLQLPPLWTTVAY